MNKFKSYLIAVLFLALIIFAGFQCIAAVAFCQEAASTPIQLKLKKVSSTTEQQRFFSGDLTTASGCLTPKMNLAMPEPGSVFWLLEVEFANASITPIEMEGNKLSARTAEGKAVTLWGFWGGKSKVYVPGIFSSWTVAGGKKQKEKFLATVEAGTKKSDFIYEGVDSLVISMGENGKNKRK
jgi:hypothetical protein